MPPRTKTAAKGKAKATAPKRAARGRGGKTAKQTATATPALVPQPNGRGALLSGGMPGNAGGPGRPPSIIRERLRGSYEQRIAVLEQVADGEAMERVEVPLATVLPHARCPKCEGPVEAKDAATLVLISVEGTRSARVAERIAALDQMAKYGLGTTKELTVDHVRGRLEETYRVLLAELPADLFERVNARLSEVWQ